MTVEHLSRGDADEIGAQLARLRLDDVCGETH